MSNPPKFKTSAEAKKAGWFSRRHQTNKEHLKTQEKRKLKNATNLTKEI